MTEYTIEMLVVICTRDNTRPIIAALKEHHAVLFNVVYGHGSAKNNNTLLALGLDIEDKKAVIFSFIKKENVRGAFETLINQFSFNEPNTGFAFTIPVEKATV